MRTSDEHHAEIARVYWRDRAARLPGHEAVHPRSRFLGYEAWTRSMVQRWTVARLRADRPRYRRVLDVGCGHGDWTELFSAFADELFATDVAPAFVEATQRRVPRAEVSLGDLRTQALPPSLDLVYLGAVLCYLPQRDVLDVLRRVRAATAPGALVVWRDWCTFNLGRRSEQREAARYSVHRTPDELVHLALAAGLKPVERRSSPGIYGEVMGGRFAQWPLRTLWRLVSLPVTRASHTLILRAR